MTTRILVTGSRTWTNETLVDRAIRAVMERFPEDSVTDFIIVHGQARGADTLADQWAIANGATPERHPANWGTGRHAGHLRNEEMARTWPEYAIAFAHHCRKERCVDSMGYRRPVPHHTHGTNDMIERLALHRIPYDLVEEDGQ